MTKLLLALIRLYQLLLSPLLGNVCRYEPSCSRYAAGCLESHGALRGSWLALKRVGRCHPFHAGGFDPPPPRVRAPSVDRFRAVTSSPAARDARAVTSSPAARDARAATSSPASPESSCHTECRAHGCSR